MRRRRVARGSVRPQLGHALLLTRPRHGRQPGDPSCRPLPYRRLVVQRRRTRRGRVGLGVVRLIAIRSQPHCEIDRPSGGLFRCDVADQVCAYPVVVQSGACRVEGRSLARCRSSPQSPSSGDAPLCVDDCFGMDCFGVDDRSEMEWAATDRSSQGGASEGLDLPHVVDLPATKHTPEDPAWGMDADAVHGPDETAPESCRRPDTESRCLPRLRTASAHANRVRWLFLVRRCGVPEGFIASLWLLR